MLWSMLNEAQSKETTHAERAAQLDEMASYAQTLQSASETELQQWSQLADEYQQRLQAVSARLASSSQEAAQAQADAAQVRVRGRVRAARVRGRACVPPACARCVCAPVAPERQACVVARSKVAVSSSPFGRRSRRPRRPGRRPRPRGTRRRSCARTTSSSSSTTSNCAPTVSS